METTTTPKYKVAVIGSRTFQDKEKLFEVLSRNKQKIKLIVSGGANGADTIATEWAIAYGMPYLVFPALWRDPDNGFALDRGAGFRRNRRIIEACDVVIAFWDGVSKGTLHSLEMAKQLNKPVKIIRFQVAPTTDVSNVVFGAIQKVAIDPRPVARSKSSASELLSNDKNDTSVPVDNTVKSPPDSFPL